MIEEYIGRRKGEMKWGKLSLIKEIREIFFNAREKGGGERGKVKLILFTFGLRRE